MKNFFHLIRALLFIAVAALPNVMAFAADKGYIDADSTVIKNVQRQLKLLELDPGPVDGIAGPLTNRAVGRFQKKNNLPPADLVIFGRISTQLIGVVDAAAAKVKKTEVERPLPKELRIAMDGESKPYNWVEESPNGKKFKGFDADIALALCNRLNMRCVFLQIEWAKIIPSLNEGKFDAIISGMAITEERKKFVSFTKSYANSDNVFVRRRTSKKVQSFSFEEMSGMKFTQVSATTQFYYVNENFGGIAKIIQESNIEKVISNLASGTADIAVFDELDAEAMLASPAGSCCEIVGQRIEGLDQGTGIAVRKQDTALRDKLNTAINEIHDNGSYSVISINNFGRDVWGR